MPEGRHDDLPSYKRWWFSTAMVMFTRGQEGYNGDEMEHTIGISHECGATIRSSVFCLPMANTWILLARLALCQPLLGIWQVSNISSEIRHLLSQSYGGYQPSCYCTVKHLKNLASQCRSIQNPRACRRQRRAQTYLLVRNPGVKGGPPYPPLWEDTTPKI